MWFFAEVTHELHIDTYSALSSKRFAVFIHYFLLLKMYKDRVVNFKSTNNLAFNRLTLSQSELGHGQQYNGIQHQSMTPHSVAVVVQCSAAAAAATAAAATAATAAAD